MIKFSDVLDAAALALDDTAVKAIEDAEVKADPRIRVLIRTILKASERDALNAINDGHCDEVIFSRYKYVRSFVELWTSYMDEKYAIGS